MIAESRVERLWNLVYSVFVLLQLYKLYKFFKRLFTGTSELSRLCTPRRESRLMKLVDIVRVPLMDNKSLYISVETVYKVDQSILHSTALTARCSMFG
jgi:hypothetical protein